MELISFSRVTSAQQFQLAYTSNLNCNLEACKCYGFDLGGMLQLKGAIDSLRKKNPDVIFVDSGDFLKTYPLARANSLMIDLMAKMDYDAIGVGDQEYVEGREFLFDQLRSHSLPLISTNIINVKSGRFEFSSHKIIIKNGIKVEILSVAFPHSFSFIEEPAIRIFPVENSIRQHVDNLKEKVDLIVLLCHSSYRAALQLAGEFPEISIIVAGHTQEKTARLVDNQIVVQAGMDGEYLGILEVKFELEKISFQNKFIPVHPGYGENPMFKIKLEDFYLQLKAVKN